MSSPPTFNSRVRGGNEFQAALKLVAAQHRTTVSDLITDALEAQFGEELEHARNLLRASVVAQTHYNSGSRNDE